MSVLCPPAPGAACLDYLRAGDTLAVWRIDRLGRSVADLTTIVNSLGERGIEFRSLTEAIDTTIVGGKLGLPRLRRSRPDGTPADR